jgi:hypothetical protein
VAIWRFFFKTNQKKKKQIIFEFWMGFADLGFIEKAGSGLVHGQQGWK